MVIFMGELLVSGRLQGSDFYAQSDDTNRDLKAIGLQKFSFFSKRIHAESPVGTAFSDFAGIV